MMSNYASKAAVSGQDRGPCPECGEMINPLTLPKGSIAKLVNGRVQVIWAGCIVCFWKKNAERHDGKIECDQCKAAVPYEQCRVIRTKWKIVCSIECEQMAWRL